jgi:hypothetical protein
MMIQLIYYFSPHSRHIQQKINSGIIPIQPHPHNFFQIENSTSLPHGEGENGFSNDRNDDRMMPKVQEKVVTMSRALFVFLTQTSPPTIFFQIENSATPLHTERGE